MPDDIKETPLIAATNEVEQDRALTVARTEAGTDNVRAANEHIRAECRLIGAKAALRAAFALAVLAAIRLG